MNIVDLANEPEIAREQAAALLVEHFVEPLGWPDLDTARAEVELVLRQGFARAMVESERVLGWVGGLPEYDGRVWELHPMVVDRDFRWQGIGRALAEAF